MSEVFSSFPAQLQRQLSDTSMGSLSFVSNSSYLWLKRSLDVGAVLLALLLLAPLFLLLALLVRRDGGPAFFGHMRVGRGGVPFRCLKFRSMHLDAAPRLAALLASHPEMAAEWRESRKLRRDPRVTPIGQFLRRTSLDELPQLLNVLRGEMSLVGPRPVTVDELVEHYGPDNARAFVQVKPGVTGLWQVSGRSDTGYSERVQLDRRYVAEMSPLLDLSILARTVPAVLAGRGAV